MSAPTGDTDPLSEVIDRHGVMAKDQATGEWRCSCGAALSEPSIPIVWKVLSNHRADAIRAALADGWLPLRSVLPAQVAAVLDAAIAYQPLYGTQGTRVERMYATARIANAVEALPEHLRGGS